MKLTKRPREGYLVLNNEYHSPPHTKKPIVQSGKTTISPSNSPNRPLTPEDLYSYKCTQCPPKDFKQDIRNLSIDIRTHLRHTFLRLRRRPEDIKRLDILETMSIRSRALHRCPSHTETCAWVLTRRSILKSGLQNEDVTVEDWLHTLQHFAQVEKIKNEMEKEKKAIGWARWKYWKWVDGKQGTRLAEERLGERVEVKREAEREWRGI